MGNCIICTKPKKSNDSTKLSRGAEGQRYGKKDQQITFDNLPHLKNDKGNNKSIIIKSNPKTKKLEGVPRKWLSKKYCDKNIIDETKVIDAEIDSSQMSDDNIDDDFREQRQRDRLNNDFRNLGESIITISDGGYRNTIRDSDIVVCIEGSEIQKSNLDRSQIATNLKVDKNQKFGIKNLPQLWASKLEASGLTGQETKQHPQVLIDLIKNQSWFSLQSSVRSKVPDNLITEAQFMEVVQKVQVIYYNPIKKYEFRKKLGSGAMCQVFEAVNKKSEKQIYAVRIMKNQKPEKLLKIQEQIALMKLCESDNIVKHIETYYFNEIIFMFIEFMDGGSFTQIIQASFRRKSGVPETIIAYVIKQILKGLEVLHKKKRIHRDLKSDNILLSKNGDVKIADFGFAAQLTKQKERRNTLVGTPCWMAPELIRKVDYTQKVDIWSIGVIILQMIRGQPPYLRLPPLKAMYLIASKEAPEISGSVELKSFYSKCMAKDPSQRASCSQLLKHPFLKQIKDQSKSKAQFVKYLKSM